jgi:hypothetical protein
MVEEIEDLVLSDRQMKLVFIARVIGVPETTVWKVLHDDLGIKKMSACWIPRLHTSEQKKFDSFTSFFSRIVTRIDAWVHKSSLPPNRVVCQNNHGNHFLGRGRNHAY